MLEFVKRNKIFCGCLSFCFVIIILLTGLILFKDDNGKTQLPFIPPKDIEEKKEPEITLFSGNFNDDKDVVELTWDYQINGHNFQKIELYRNGEVIKTIYHDRTFEVSIYDYDICTGDNEFELYLYYDNGIITTKDCEVFVDYVFNAEVNLQRIDNNLGNGYLLIFEYDYNTVTPVGIPTKNTTKISTKESAPTYWSWKYLTFESNPLNNGYQKMKVYYLIQLENIPNEEITWLFDSRLDSVGVRIEKSIVNNPSTSNVITTDFELK